MNTTGRNTHITAVATNQMAAWRKHDSKQQQHTYNQQPACEQPGTQHKPRGADQTTVCYTVLNMCEWGEGQIKGVLYSAEHVHGGEGQIKGVLYSAEHVSVG
jgi:hypothetical protein